MKFRCIAAMAGAFVLALASAQESVGRSPEPVSDSPPVGTFALIDHMGRAVTERSYRGQFMLIFFGYTYCPDVCPTDLQIIGDAIDRLGRAATKIRPLFVTLDPERDTPETLADYVANFHPRLTGLTGRPDQIRRAANAFRVGYYKVFPERTAKSGRRDNTEANDLSDGDDYLLAHSAVTYLMGPDGRLVRVFDHQTDPVEMATEIRWQIDRFQRMNSE